MSAPPLQRASTTAEKRTRSEAKWWDEGVKSGLRNRRSHLDRRRRARAGWIKCQDMPTSDPRL